MSREDFMAVLAAIVFIIMVTRYSCERTVEHPQRLAVGGLVGCWPTSVVEPMQWETPFVPFRDDTEWTCVA
jgi:hypothetical protein